MHTPRLAEQASQRNFASKTSESSGLKQLRNEKLDETKRVTLKIFAGLQAKSTQNTHDGS
jgi:hypothetical protein